MLVAPVRAFLTRLLATPRILQEDVPSDERTSPNAFPRVRVPPSLATCPSAASLQEAGEGASANSGRFLPGPAIRAPVAVQMSFLSDRYRRVVGAAQEDFNRPLHKPPPRHPNLRLHQRPQRFV